MSSQHLVPDKVVERLESPAAALIRAAAGGDGGGGGGGGAPPPLPPMPSLPPLPGEADAADSPPPPPPEVPDFRESQHEVRSRTRTWDGHPDPMHPLSKGSLFAVSWTSAPADATAATGT
eukprot:SAG22_NODE_981_length_6166_cov_17.901928_4_plen_120_part_00